MDQIHNFICAYLWTQECFHFGEIKLASYGEKVDSVFIELLLFTVYTKPLYIVIKMAEQMLSREACQAMEKLLPWGKDVLFVNVPLSSQKSWFFHFNTSFEVQNIASTQTCYSIK